MLEWRKSLRDGLKGPRAPRVPTFHDLVELSEQLQLGVSPKAVRSFVRNSVESGALVPVRKGVWLNPSAFPSPAIVEAAARIRSGAVISLQSVLGDAGILNNFTSQVFTIVPIPEIGGNPVLGQIEAAGTIFHFRAIPQAILEAGDQSDRLVPFLHYARATPEAALVHWIYLAKSTGSSLRMPDTQCDVSLLDGERVERLAELAGVRHAAMAWIEKCKVREDLDDEHVGWRGGPK